MDDHDKISKLSDTILSLRSTLTHIYHRSDACECRDLTATEASYEIGEIRSMALLALGSVLMVLHPKPKNNN